MGCHDDICGEWNDPPATPRGQCKPLPLRNHCGLTPPYVNDEAQQCTDTCPEGLIGDPIIVTIGIGTVASAFSTSNANDLAEIEACQQAAALRALTPCLYPSEEQECTNTCPEGEAGDPITVVVSAGQFTGVTQEQANALALAEACAQADALRLGSPCGAAGMPAVTSAESQTKSGTATLIGCPEYGTPSEPPRMFRRREDSGMSVTTDFSDPDCTMITVGEGANVVTCTHGSWMQYDALTGAITFGGATNCVNNLGEPSSFPAIIIDCTGFTPDGCDVFWTINSSTVAARNSTGNCCLVGSIFRKATVESFQRNLTDEDTEDDAETREMASIGSWTSVASDHVDSTATREQRTGVDISFDFRHSQVRITTGSIGDPLTVGQDYRVTIVFTRRTLGTSDPYLPLSQVQYDFTAAATTDVGDWIDVPNEAGFETRYESSSAETI